MASSSRSVRDAVFDDYLLPKYCRKVKADKWAPEAADACRRITAPAPARHTAITPGSYFDVNRVLGRGRRAVVAHATPDAVVAAAVETTTDVLSGDRKPSSRRVSAAAEELEAAALVAANTVTDAIASGDAETAEEGMQQLQQVEAAAAALSDATGMPDAQQAHAAVAELSEQVQADVVEALDEEDDAETRRQEAWMQAQGKQEAETRQKIDQLQRDIAAIKAGTLGALDVDVPSVAPFGFSAAHTAITNLTEELKHLRYMALQKIARKEAAIQEEAAAKYRRDHAPPPVISFTSAVPSRPPAPSAASSAPFSFGAPPAAPFSYRAPPAAPSAAPFSFGAPSAAPFSFPRQ